MRDFNRSGLQELGGAVGPSFSCTVVRAPFALDRLDSVFALPVRYPGYTLLLRRVCAARQHGDLVGDDERGVEADAELPDQLRVLRPVARQPLQRTGPCPSARSCPE